MLIIWLWFLNVTPCISLMWERVDCSSDAEQAMPEGKASDIGRFPWLGVVQHSFFLGDKVRFAITSGVLIHPAYVLAPAEDIAKIQPEQLINNTKFIMWKSDAVKYALDVKDYLLHPEYLEKLTFATVALLQLYTMGETGAGINANAVLPVCLPVKGSGLFTDLYVVKMTDENKVLEKEVLKMKYVDETDCEEFYRRAQLNYKKMKPVSSTCAVSETMHESCVWDAGAVLITRQSWGYWKLLGFGVRGPGCGAPSRFLNVHKYLPWIDEIISRKPSEDFEDDEAEDTKKFALRRLSPVELIMYPASKVKTKEFGQCERGDRGHVLYKDSTELLVSKNFAQGFFFVVVSQIAQFTCMSVILDVTDRTNAEMWIEHYCHPDIAGLAHGVGDQLHRTDDYKKLECFVYFKSAAFIEFRFYFSFKALLEVTLFGTEEIPRRMPVPYFTDITTDSWWPTAEIIRWGSFVPYYMWWYWL